ncbi:hypothetical protein H6G93_07940 [Nostoc sp. FACHB-973]|nr:hypothetical protein [Nostoc sp. FACHB-973]
MSNVVNTGVQVSSEQKIGIISVTEILQEFGGAETLDLSLDSSWLFEK